MNNDVPTKYTFEEKYEDDVNGRVIDQYRSSLKPNVIEALVYTRDWLYGE
jgi:hypothetical protein